MKVILCEDEPAQQKWMESALFEWQKKTGTNLELNIYGSGEELFFKKDEWADADAVILDIELKEMNGMEIAKAIRNTDKQISIFFTTGYEKYVFEGYEVGAISYIMKPIDKVKLFTALDKAKENCREQDRSFLVEQNQETIRIYMRDILYVESDGHYCVLHTKNDRILMREKISSLYAKLENRGFFLCHRSYIVNMAYVSRITKKDIILDDMHKIPIARGKWEAVNKAFLEYYRVCQS